MVRSFSSAVGVTFVALLLPACGSQQRYSDVDVKRAFRAHGFELAAAVVDGRPQRDGNGVLLVPRSHENFFVLVEPSDDVADAYYRTLQSQRTPGTLDVRRRNVIASSDGGLPPDQRRRIRAALRSLS